MAETMESALGANSTEGVTIESLLANEAATAEDFVEHAFQEAEASETETTPVAESTTPPETPPQETNISAEEQSGGAGGPETGGETETAEGQTHETLSPPAHWEADAQETFGKLDPAAQRFLLDRATQQDQQFQQQVEQVAPFVNFVQSAMPYLQQVQTTPEMYFGNLLQTEQTLRTGTPEQKMGMLFNIAQDYGIPLRQLIQQRHQQQAAIDPETGEPDPIAQAVEQATAPLRQQIQQMQQGYQQQQQQQTTQQQAQQARMLQSFAEQKNQDGQLLHPHFFEVQEDMVALAEGEVARFGRVQSTIDQLYQRATWANDGVRAKLNLQQKAATDQERRTQQKQQVEKARQAGASVVGTGKPNDVPHAEHKDVESLIGALWDEAATG